MTEASAGARDVVALLGVLIGHPFARCVLTALDGAPQAHRRDLALALLVELRTELLEQLTAVRAALVAIEPARPEGASRQVEAYASLLDAITAVNAGALASAHACASYATRLLGDPHAPLTETPAAVEVSGESTPPTAGAHASVDDLRAALGHARREIERLQSRLTASRVSARTLLTIFEAPDEGAVFDQHVHAALGRGDDGTTERGANRDAPAPQGAPPPDHRATQGAVPLRAEPGAGELLGARAAAEVLVSRLLTDEAAMEQIDRVFRLAALGASERLVLLAVICAATTEQPTGEAPELSVEDLTSRTALSTAQVEQAVEKLRREGELQQTGRSVTLRPTGSGV